MVNLVGFLEVTEGIQDYVSTENVWEVVEMRNGSDIHAGALFLLFPGLAPELSEQVIERSCFTPKVLSIPLGNLLLEFRVLQLQVVFEFVGIHDASDGNAILLEDDILFIQMNLPYHLTKIDAGFGERKSINCGFRAHDR